MKKEIKIGLTGVAALLILFFGIKFLKGANLFSSSNTYYIRFSNVKALSKNSTVYADGYNVGTVSDIIYDFDHPGKVLVEISTTKGLRIPKGSTASLDEAMLGGCTLNMLLATNLRESYQPGDTIIGSDAGGLMSKATDLMPKVDQVLARVDTLLATLNTLASDPNLPLILKNAETLTANLNESSMELKRLLAQDVPAMTSTFNKAGENVVALTDNLNRLNLQSTMDSVNCTIGNVNRMVTQMQSKEGSLGLLMNDPAVYNNLNHTVQSADSLLTDLKAHPKLYVHFSLFGKKDK